MHIIYCVERYEVGLSEISIREKVDYLAYSPLLEDFLTGKYRNNNFSENKTWNYLLIYYTRYKT